MPTTVLSLHLHPLNDSFNTRVISLSPNQHVKIGRHVASRSTTPCEQNAYFDSKVMSRQHAELWEEGNKILIKDTKSSNGTYLNGERLSEEGLESEPYELGGNDIVDFGIDIFGQDNETIIHSKISARVVCAFTKQAAL